MNAYRDRKPSGRLSMLAIACSMMIAGTADAAAFVDKAEVTRARRVIPPATEKRCWTEWEQSAADVAGSPPLQVASIPPAFGGFKFVATSSAAATTTGTEVAVAGGGSAVKSTEHCIEEPGAAKPAYWEVEYTYRGLPFTTRLNYDPGPQLSVRVVVDPQP